MCKCNQNLRYAVTFASFSSKRNFMSFIMYRSRVPAVCRAASILVSAVFAGRKGVRTQKPILGFVSAALFAYICHPIAVRR